jgi:two-component system, response regulator PdtaR
LLFSVAESLRDNGCIVFEATNADAALVYLAQRPDISVVFTDIDMPGSMDGLRLAAAVRDTWPAVKVILTSGKTRVVPPHDNVFLPKPYDYNVVSDAVRRVLD